MNYYDNLPIYKKALDLTVYFERLVRGFSRYDKYTLGSDLRDLSREITVLCALAVKSADGERKETLLKIRKHLEELKVVIRICRETNAFNRSNSFQYSVELTEDISRQNEGWIKKTN